MYVRFRNATGENVTIAYDRVVGMDGCTTTGRPFICMSDCHVSLAKKIGVQIYLQKFSASRLVRYARSNLWRRLQMELEFGAEGQLTTEAEPGKLNFAFWHIFLSEKSKLLH